MAAVPVQGTARAVKAWRPANALSMAGARLPHTLPLPRILLLAGLVALIIPTLFSLAKGYWSTNNGAHGPILLVSGIWLFVREREHIHLRIGSASAGWTIGLLAPLLLCYAYARTFDSLTLESAALYAILLLLAVRYWAPETLQRMWFAIAYLGFLVRPPVGLMAELTGPLKMWISGAAVSLLHWLEYPIARAGVHIQVGQYELLVQQACAGLGSIFSLFAICLLYVHLAQRPEARGKPEARANMILLLAVIPVALAANYLRVVILILLTFHAGNNVAQGFAHDAAGIVTFVLSLVGMALVDWGLRLVEMRRRWHAKV